MLCQLAAVYRDRLNEPEKAATALRESLADMPFYTMPLEKLIADQWPAKKSDAVARSGTGSSPSGRHGSRGGVGTTGPVRYRHRHAKPRRPGKLLAGRAAISGHREALGTAERASRRLAPAPCRLDQSAESRTGRRLNSTSTVSPPHGRSTN